MNNTLIDHVFHSKRFNGLLWGCLAAGVAASFSWLSANLGILQLDPTWTLFLAAILTQLTKGINNWVNGKDLNVISSS